MRNFFFFARKSPIGPRLLLFEVSKSRADTHLVGLLWTSDQHVAEVSANTPHYKHKRRPCMPSAGFEPAIPVEWLQTYAVYCTATGIVGQNPVLYVLASMFLDQTRRRKILTNFICSESVHVSF
jgi:hypothetical protein